MATVRMIAREKAREKLSQKVHIAREHLRETIKNPTVDYDEKK